MGTKIFCDRCGNNIPVREEVTLVMTGSKIKSIELDLCPSCTYTFKAYLGVTE